LLDEHARRLRLRKVLQARERHFADADPVHFQSQIEGATVAQVVLDLCVHRGADLLRFGRG
jgi:hypothetical protein